MKTAEGFLQQYLPYVSEMCDAPPVFAYFVGIGVIGSILGNKVYRRWQDGKLYPNCWICLVAPSSTFRKTTSLNFGRNLIRKAKPEVLLTTSFSAESLWDILSKQPQGLFVYDEFSELMGMLARDYATGARAFLAKLYDNPEVPPTRQLRGRDWEIKSPCISMLAATTSNWWLAKKEDLTGGFYPRWLFVGAKTKAETIAFPPPADLTKQNALVKALVKISTLKGEVTFSPEADQYYTAWLKRFEGRDFGRKSILNPFLSRYANYAIKLAIILEIDATGQSIISPRAMKEACHLIDWVSRELATLADEAWVFTTWERNRGWVSRLIRENQENGGISLSELIRATRIKSKDLQEILLNLQEGGEAKPLKQEAKGRGRPKTRYVPTDPLPGDLIFPGSGWKELGSKGKEGENA